MLSFEYYTCIIAITCLSLLTLAILIFENGRLLKEDKRNFLIAIIGIAIASLAEWGSIALNGAPGHTILLHNIVKGLDYITTPIACSMFIMPVIKDRSIIHKILRAVLGFNLVIQIVSMFTGWLYYIDEDNYYQHGDLYFLYYVVSGIVFLIVTLEFIRYGLKYKKKNVLSVILIALLVVLGIVLQEFISSDLRTICISLSLGATFLFIHYTEFTQMDFDIDLEEKEILLLRDPLTDLFSRFAYTRTLAAYDKNLKSDVLGEHNFAVCECDLNGLKAVNDNEGHEAGDAYIKRCAEVLKEIFDCITIYRTGGDEFVILIEGEESKHLEKYQERIDKQNEKEPLFSAGFAAYDSMIDSCFDDVFKRADKNMYKAKSEYYKATGRDRRSR